MPLIASDKSTIHVQSHAFPRKPAQIATASRYGVHGRARSGGSIEVAPAERDSLPCGPRSRHRSASARDQFAPTASALRSPARGPRKIVHAGRIIARSEHDLGSGDPERGRKMGCLYQIVADVPADTADNGDSLIAIGN
jgi:hypothetical protein